MQPNIAMKSFLARPLQAYEGRLKSFKRDSDLLPSTF